MEGFSETNLKYCRLFFQYTLNSPQVEDEEAALQREILEELNASIEIMERMPEHVHAYTPEKEIRLIPYRCTLAVGATLHAREHAELRWVSKSDLLSLDWAAADVPVVKDVMRML
jgi:8-oxo-dGTP diphosphatase